MRRLSAQRRKVAVLAALVAIMSGVAPALREKHPELVGWWLGLMVVMLVFALVQMVKLKRQEH